MKPCMPLVAMFFASATFPLLAQQPTSPDQSGNPTSSSPATQPSTTTQQNPPTATSPVQNGSNQTSDTSAAPMSPVNGELVSKLDSKTAKPGDNVVVQTKGSLKTESGTDVPEGSKLVGHVLAVQPSGEGTNSQLVLQFDHVELKSGQSLPVHSEIESIGSGQGTAAGQTAGSPGTMSGPATATTDRSANQGSNSPTTSGTNGSTPSTTGSSTSAAGSSPNAASSGTTGATGSSTSSGDSRATAMGNGAPAAGTVVAKNGNIAIQTTSIPGVLLANNAPGQSDPRMARASSILLGVKRDIQLDSGTQVVVGVSAAGAAAH